MDKNKTNKTKQRQGAGRPKIYLDLEILKNLASIGCPDLIDMERAMETASVSANSVMASARGARSLNTSNEN